MQRDLYAKVGSVQGVKTMKDLFEKLNEEANSLTYIYNEETFRLTTCLLTTIDKGLKYDHIVWYDVEFLKNIIFYRIYIDGTFKVRPNIKLNWGKSQFLTIMVEVNENVSKYNNFSSILC